jgi:hypothetical protein
LNAVPEGPNKPIPGDGIGHQSDTVPPGFLTLDGMVHSVMTGGDKFGGLTMEDFAERYDLFPHQTPPALNDLAMKLYITMIFTNSEALKASIRVG